MSQLELPKRTSPLPETTGDNIPHIQKSQLGPRNLVDNLCDWAFSTLPDMSEEKSIMSFDSTRALWLDDHVQLKHLHYFSIFLTKSL